MKGRKAAGTGRGKVDCSGEAGSGKKVVGSGCGVDGTVEAGGRGEEETAGRSRSEDVAADIPWRGCANGMIPEDRAFVEALESGELNAKHPHPESTSWWDLKEDAYDEE